MKKLFLFFALIIGLLASASTAMAQTVNMSRYITLTVKNGAAIQLNFRAAADGTPIRIVSGSNTQDITVGTNWYDSNWPRTYTVTAAASTMTIYGDLTTFDCQSNGANLTALDPSHNTQLKELRCYSNLLTSLDVSQNTQLTWLDCCINNLSNLDVSHNTQLTKLSCRNNNLSSLDVSKNTQLEELYYWGNKFTTAALDDIYCALPDRTGKEYGVIYTLHDTSSVTEQAIVKATNAANATAKNWKIRYWMNNTDIATTGSYVCGTLNTDNYITLTVADSAEIRLNFRAAFDGTPVKIVSGSRDTTFTVDDWWATFSKEYKSDGTEMTIYGTITGFNCEYNYENLTALDVSHNADLQELQCDNNYITDLDVTKNTLLKKLSCSNNKITDLDLSKNTELEEFGCSYNRSLSSLDLSKNTKLTHLWCYESQLTSLNIKNCKELKYLDCHHNKLQSLDVSGSKGLWHVYCHHNNFTTQTLDDLFCSLPDRTGTSYGEISPIYSRRSEDSTIVAATNKQNAIDKNWKVRFDDKSDIPATTGTYECPELNMNRYITLTVDNGGEITLDFKAAANVTPVRIVSGSTTQDITVGTDWYNDNTQSTFTVTADGTEMKVYGDLTGFSCGENFGNLTALDASNNKSLTQLYCFENQLSSLNISKNRALDTLSCNESQLASLDVSNNTNLKYLNCSDNQLTNLDVSKNTQLTNLSCSDNNLDSLDVSKNTELTNLSCSDNKLRDLDVSKNTKLEWLYCAKNPLDSLDVSRNTRLTDLHCYSNQLSVLDVSNNRLLETLECNSNRLTDLNVLQNKRLTQLYCYSNKLSSLSIKRNTQLEKLYCWDNNFSTQALDDIYCALPNRTGKDNGEIFPLRDTSSAAEVDSVGATTAKNATDKNWKVWKYNQVGGNTDITTNGSYDCSTAVADATTEQALTLYPNPVADVLYLSATARTVRIYNIYGIEVARATDTDKVEVSHLPAGVYTVKADGMVAKMVKR